MRIFKRVLLGVATAIFLGLFFLRLSAPPRNILEDAFQKHLAGRVEKGKAAFVLFGDPKT